MLEKIYNTTFLINLQTHLEVQFFTSKLNKKKLMHEESRE
jgi:hypothetical protein